MSQTYSTRQRELTRGQLFSSRFSAAAPAPGHPPVVTVTVPPATAPPAAVPEAAMLAVAAPAAEPAPVPAPPVLPEQRLTFALSPQGVVPTPPGAASAKGAVAVTGRPGSPHTVNAAVTGLAPHRDPALQPTLWLIHDLTVPVDLAPADLAQLPMGVGLTGNRPGAIFTVDGNAPTSDRTIREPARFTPSREGGPLRAA